MYDMCHSFYVICSSAWAASVSPIHMIGLLLALFTLELLSRLFFILHYTEAASDSESSWSLSSSL